MSSLLRQERALYEIHSGQGLDITDGFRVVNSYHSPLRVSKPFPTDFGLIIQIQGQEFNRVCNLDFLGGRSVEIVVGRLVNINLIPLEKA